MSDDKELLARLRGRGFGLMEEAADRIEALTAKVKLMDDLDAISEEKIEALEAKLAGAVESAFEEGFLAAAEDGWVNNPRIEMEWKRSKALAELKGKSHD